MPLPLLPLILAGGGALVAGATSWVNKRQSDKNMYLQERQNKLNWEQQQQMYQQQRNDALTDWSRQNEYNSPEQQMQRLRQAGLNPNLVYGKGADNTAESIRSVQPQQVNRTAPASTFAPNFSGMMQGVQGSLSNYYDIKNKQAQTDNLAQSTALMQQEALFKQANTAKTLTDNARGKFDLQQAQELKDSVIENQKLSNEKLRADTLFTTHSDERSELSNSSNVKLTLEKILSERIARAKDQQTIDLYKAQLQNLNQTNDILTYEQKLTEMGIHKSDPWYFRAFMNLLNGNVDPVHDLLEKINPSGVPDYTPPPSWLMKKK